MKKRVVNENTHFVFQKVIKTTRNMLLNNKLQNLKIPAFQSSRRMIQVSKQFMPTQFRNFETVLNQKLNTGRT